MLSSDLALFPGLGFRHSHVSNTDVVVEVATLGIKRVADGASVRLQVEMRGGDVLLDVVIVSEASVALRTRELLVQLVDSPFVVNEFGVSEKVLLTVVAFEWSRHVSVLLLQVTVQAGPRIVDFSALVANQFLRLDVQVFPVDVSLLTVQALEGFSTNLARVPPHAHVNVF